MKHLLTFLICTLSWCTFAQSHNRQIDLTRKGNLQTKEKAVNNATADKALRIASYLFNSKEFQDSIAKLSFPYYNHCIECSHGKDKNELIPGKVILDSIFRKPTVALELRMESFGKKPSYSRNPKNNKCFGLGRTCPDSYITSYYENINCDMAANLPFPAAYAVHLSHEYLHFVGYCHKTNDVQTDVAEAVGWIAYYFIEKWNAAHDPGLIAILND